MRREHNSLKAIIKKVDDRSTLIIACIYVMQSNKVKVEIQGQILSFSHSNGQLEVSI